MKIYVASSWRNKFQSTVVEKLKWAGHDVYDFKKSGPNMQALKECDLCVLVLPSGRRSYLELGWAVGQGKKTAILHTKSFEVGPELMLKMVDRQFQYTFELINWIDSLTPSVS